MNQSYAKQKFKKKNADRKVWVVCQDSDCEFEVLLLVFLVELRSINILVGPDLMCEMYYMFRESYANRHGVLENIRNI